MSQTSLQEQPTFELPNWVYEPAPLNGGAPGDAYKSTFNGAGKKPAAVLAREALQNSVDAASDPNASVRVEFRFKALSGDAKIKFEEASGIEEMRARLEHLGVTKGSILHDPAVELTLLYIDDFETTGLLGDPTEPSSRLRKLLMDLGGSDKAKATDSTGGSYGFGKAVYSSNSRIGTIFAYSKTHDKLGNPLTVLMGCAYQSSHEVDGREFTGRAWFGKPIDVLHRGIRFDPFQGPEAEHLAGRLGFVERNGAGTAILLVDTQIKPEDIIAGVEDYWWPRLNEKRLNVSVFDVLGNESFPKPNQRKHLRPFIEAFDAARGRIEIPGKVQCKKFNKKGDTELGALGVKVLEDSEDGFPLGEDYETWQDTVALVRGPLMVVEYYNHWYPVATAPKAVGAFYAASDVDRVLKLSEPPAHDKWDSDAQRLTAQGEGGGEVVSTILSRIKVAFKEFQRNAKPPEPNHPKRLSQLERALADWFGVGPKGPKPGPEPDAAPVSLRPGVPEPLLKDGMLRLKGSLLIDVSPTQDVEEVQFQLRLTCQVGEEEGMSSSDPVALTVEPNAQLTKVSDGWVGSVKSGEPPTVTYTTELYDPEWTVRIVPELVPYQEGEE